MKNNLELVDFLLDFVYNPVMKSLFPEKDIDFLRELIDEICAPFLSKPVVKTLKEMTPKEKKALEKKYKCKIKENCE